MSQRLLIYFFLPALAGIFFSGCSLFKSSSASASAPPADTPYTLPSAGSAPPPASSGASSRKREDIIQYARKFKGTKYKYGGTNPNTGFDCSGFVSYVYNHFNITLPRTSRDQENEGHMIRLRDAKAGDLIFWRRSPDDQVFHVSLVVDNDPSGVTVIHSVNRGVTEENIAQSSYWNVLYVSARDILN